MAIDVLLLLCGIFYAVLCVFSKLYPEKWTQDFATTPDCRQRIRNVDKQSA